MKLKTIRSVTWAGFAFALALLTVPTTARAADEHVVLAGGCFWGMQAVFASLNGVDRTTAGFAGGAAATANYETVSTGTTGHAESVDITFNPQKISFEQLLAVYFLVAHDPTELNRQGPDDGPQYRSEIFYTTPQQRDEATAYIAHLTHDHVYTAPIVTQIAPLRGFYTAENYHQNFLVNNPTNPYIVQEDLPKLRALEKRFPSLVNHGAPTIETLARS